MSDKGLIRRGDAVAQAPGGFAMTHPIATLIAGVKVKPLKWENFDAWTYWARCPIGTYHVEERNGVWKATLDRNRGLELVYEYTTDGLTPDDFQAAQIAAQADYEARVLAALEAAPHVNETPKCAHDDADVLSTPPDLVEAAGKVAAKLRMLQQWKLGRDAADLITALIAHCTAQQAQIEHWRRNGRETFDAMCAMRDSINEHVPMPSLESDLLQGPESSVFCAAVAQAVVSHATAQAAQIAGLEAELSSGSFYKEADIDALMSRAEAAEAEAATLRAEHDAWKAQCEAVQREAAKCFSAQEEIEAAWDAFGTSGNRQVLTLAEQIASHQREVDDARAALAKLEPQE